MMKEIYSSGLEFITPAFLAGADQNKPEVRPASIRGELRWWFRVLGGTREAEGQVFGRVHGEVQSSAVVVRVSDAAVKKSGKITFHPMSNKGYLYYFAQASGNKGGIHRTEAGHYLDTGTTFQLHILKRRESPSADEALLRKAVNAFVRLGALGLRATRGCGALADAENIPTRADFSVWCRTLEMESGVLIRLSDSSKLFPSGERCQESLGGFLKQFRKGHHLSGKEKSPLGFSSGNCRQASALHLRPVKVKEGFLPVIVYTDQTSDQACTELSLKLKRLFSSLPRIQ